MKDRLFDQPVFVREKAQMTREIGSVMDALDFLEEWPEEKHDLVHHTVLSACYDALDDRRPVVAVERAFARFAERAGIFEDPESVMPWLDKASCRDGQMSA